MKKIYRFTLVEILAVMALISILSALGFGVYSYAKGKAKESATEALLGQVEAGLNAFYAKNHYYPLSGGDFKSVKFTFGSDGVTVTEIDFGSASGKLTYNSSASSKADRMKNELVESFTKAVDMQTIKNSLDKDGYLVDAWGGKIYYRSPGVFKTGSYDLISAGSDGEFGTGGAGTPVGITDSGKFLNSDREKICDDIFNFK